MSEKKPSLKRKVIHAGGWQIAKRVAKSIPGAGTAIAIGLVGFDIKKKGVVRGVINSGLDAIPVVGLVKNTVEFFAGDFLADKKPKNNNQRFSNNETNK